jgi:2-phospho-L-lactate guanylyltransferase
VKNIWAIVPVKPLNRSKSRLSPVLSIKQRETLSKEMLERTLMTLKQVKSIRGIVVISRDTAALAFARQLEVQTLQESGAPELNDSLTRATQVVSSWNAGGVLVVASDIPLMQPDDIEKMVEMASSAPVVVIAADRRREGTNALLVCPPSMIPYRFGEGSFQLHIQEARAAGIEVRIHDSPTLALDVDVPADLDLYREMLLQREMEEPAWLASV